MGLIIENASPYGNSYAKNACKRLVTWHDKFPGDVDEWNKDANEILQEDLYCYLVALGDGNTLAAFEAYAYAALVAQHLHGAEWPSNEEAATALTLLAKVQVAPETVAAALLVMAALAQDRSVRDVLRDHPLWETYMREVGVVLNDDAPVERLAFVSFARTLQGEPASSLVCGPFVNLAAARMFLEQEAAKVMARFSDKSQFVYGETRISPWPAAGDEIYVLPYQPR